MKTNNGIFLKQDSGIMEISYTDRVANMKPHLHAHPGVQFVWLENFEGSLQTNDSLSHATGSDICMIGDQVPHRLISNASAVRATNLLLSKEYLNNILFGENSAGLSADRSRYFLWKIDAQQSDKVLHINKQEYHKMDRLAGALRRESQDMRDAWQMMLDCMMKEFVVWLLRAIPQRNVERFQTVQSINKYLEENAAKQFVLEDLAAEFGFHKSHLCRIFKEIQNESMYEYVARIRCDLAMERMEDTKLSITEISQDVGFSDYNQFTKYFKLYTGVTPAQWRKERRSTS